MAIWGMLPSGLEIFTIIAIAAAFEGSRRVSVGDRSRDAYIWLVFGVGYLTVRVALGVFVYISTDSLATQNRASPYKQLSADWGKTELTPEEREKKSRGYAAVAYLGTGKLYYYFDRDGTQRLFTPNQDQLREREARAITFHDLDNVVANGRTAPVTFASYILIACAFGAWIGYEQRKVRK